MLVLSRNWVKIQTDSVTRTWKFAAVRRNISALLGLYIVMYYGCAYHIFSARGDEIPAKHATGFDSSRCITRVESRPEIFRVPITHAAMTMEEDLIAVSPIRRSPRGERVEPIGEELIPNEENGGDFRALSRVPVMLHLLLPIAWAVAASMGLLAHTVLNFFFLIFYGIFTNVPRGLSFKRSRPPSLIVIISLVFSLIYIIAEIAVFLLTKGSDIKSVPHWLQDYFDIVPFQKHEHLPNVIFAYVVVVALDVVTSASRARSTADGSASVIFLFSASSTPCWGCCLSFQLPLSRSRGQMSPGAIPKSWATEF
jgi:hypothetical protein